MSDLGSVGGMADGAGSDLDQLVPRMGRLLRRLTARRGVHHAVLGAATLDGSWSWSGAAGRADPAGVPMQPDTLWFLASVTKLYRGPGPVSCR